MDRAGGYNFDFNSLIVNPYDKNVLEKKHEMIAVPFDKEIRFLCGAENGVWKQALFYSTSGTVW